MTLFWLLKLDPRQENQDSHRGSQAVTTWELFNRVLINMKGQLVATLSSF